MQLPSCDDGEFDWDAIESDPNVSQYLKSTDTGSTTSALSQFLTEHRLQELQCLFQRHQINMDDLNSWSIDDTKCVYDFFLSLSLPSFLL